MSIHSFAWLYGIKIGFVDLQICIWIKSCLNNWQKSNTKTNRHLQVKKSPRRPRNSTHASTSRKSSNTIYDLPVLVNLFYPYKTIINVMFWTFSNCRILESNYEAFEKFRKPFKSLSFEISLPAPYWTCRALNFPAFSVYFDEVILLIFASPWLSCKNNKQKIRYLWTGKRQALVKLKQTDSMEIW